MKKRLFYFIIGLTTLIAVICVNLYLQKSNASEHIETTKLESYKMKVKVITKGILKYEEEQLIFHDQTSRDIPEVFFQAGETVKKGETLIKYPPGSIEVEKEIVIL